MNAVLALRKLPDGRIQARRKDGKPLTPQDREAARLLASIGAKEPAIDSIIDDQTVAVLIDSSILDAAIWFALRDGWKPEQADGLPIFYASELPVLRQKSTEQLRSILNVKRAFVGGMVKK